MKKVLHNRSLHILIAVLMIGTVVVMLVKLSNNKAPELVTATVETGTVQQLVSVSGIASAEETAELAFPVTGTVKEVLVNKGDEVKTGDVLITLEAGAIEADRKDALASLARARADKSELLEGPSETERTVTSANVSLKQRALETTRDTENKKVENALRTLLSSNLAAASDDSTEDATAPTVSGTYICDQEGVYTLTVFSSNSASGYSYRLSGLESGIFVASVDQAVPMGDCGLRIQFSNISSPYNNSVWTIEVPNKKSSSYITNLNTYNLAVTQANTAIALAEQDLSVAEANASNNNAPARLESVARANADIAQAEARLARIDATLADRVIRAPFDGVITELDVLSGETVTPVPVITILAASEFEVTARIPEIDIGKLAVGQKALMTFDARDTEVISGTIEFISLKATEIDGVAYYEAIISFDTLPTWIRSGLNADIDVVTGEVTDVLRVPKRFVSKLADSAVVLKQVGETYATSTVEILFEGNDGYIAITGINKGDTVVAP